MNAMIAAQLLCLCVVLMKSAEAFQTGVRSSSSLHSLRMVATGVEKKRVVIVGATGYIGKFVVKESIRRGGIIVCVECPASYCFHNQKAHSYCYLFIVMNVGD